MRRRDLLSTAAMLTAAAGAAAKAKDPTAMGEAAWPQSGLRIETGLPVMDAACRLAERTLLLNVSEKWGKICPVAAPAWSTHYPAWIHPFDNFWMTHITPYLHGKEQVEWPVELFRLYQRPSGMIGWGVHGPESPHDAQARFKQSSAEVLNQESSDNRYLRDHLYVLQVCRLWKFFGDQAFAERFYPSCAKALEYLYKFKDRDGDGLVEAAAALDDVDLGRGIERSDANAVEKSVDQTLLFGALLEFADMAQALGNASEAEQARERAGILKKRFNELFWNEKGFYIFAINARTHEPVLKEHATTHANGYAILWGLAPRERVPRLLNYFTSWDFVVPGPVFLPPVISRGSNVGREVDNRPGVYANGGCGWARGHMPSFCLTLYRHGNPKLATDYLERLAKAALAAGSFHEYWTWEKYTGRTIPSGATEYSETTSGFLDGVIHGYFGISQVERGWTALKMTPQPGARERCALTLPLPGGAFTAAIYRQEERWCARIESKPTRKIEIQFPDGRSASVTVREGEAAIV